ncbi:MAG: response regulator [Magnetococcales bacterium]|nr:response regulator [Magnetococcales bacterium]
MNTQQPSTLNPVPELADRTAPATETRYRQLFEQMVSGAMILRREETNDRPFVLLDINDAGAAILGRRRKKIRDKHLCDIFPGLCRSELTESLRKVDETGQKQKSKPFHYRDGKREFWLAWNAFRLDDRGEVIFIFNDITERVLAPQIRESRMEAEAANEAKSQFLAMMSHELRTPLNSVLGMAGLLEASPLSRKQQHWLESIHISGKRLLATINQILDFSKIEAGKMQLESQPFRLTDILQNAAGIVGLELERKGLELIFDKRQDVPSRFFGDAARVEQVLINLITNAIRHSDRGEIIVRIETIAQKEQKIQLRFCIQDQGVGLTEDQQEKLFVPFTQVSSDRHRQNGGTGLGLAICKSIVENMGGRIWVESVPEKGSSFFFTLTLEVAATQTVVEEHAKQKIPSFNILLVHREGTQRDLLTEMIGEFAHRVVHAHDYDKGVKIMKKRRHLDPIDLIIMEWPEIASSLSSPPEEILRKAQAREIPIISLVSSHVLHHDHPGAGQPPGIVLAKPVFRSFLHDAILESTGKSIQRSPMSWVSKAARMRMAQRLGGAKILLVEDNDMNVHVCRELLGRLNVHVDVAENGLDAIQVLASHRFDGVLMDIQMPGMDGYEATRHIRNIMGLTDLPIIALTANALEEDRILCLQAGMNDHVAKPIDFIRLFSVMAQWIKPSTPVRVADHLPLLFDADHQDAPIHLPGIVFANGLARVGGNRKLFHKLLKNFHKKHQRTAHLLERLLIQKDHETFRREIHTLRGIAGTIGAHDLYDVASRIEHQLRTGSLDEIHPLFSKLEDHLTFLISGLGQFFQRADEDKAVQTERKISFADIPTEKIEHLRRMAHDIEEFLRLGDTRVRNLLEEVEREFADCHLPHLAEFSEAVQGYRYTDAREIFDRMMRQCSP